MASFNGIYVRATESQIGDLLVRHPTAQSEPGFAFYEIVLSGTPPEADSIELSARLDTDVLWLSFQSSADIFEFSHWRSGLRLRELAFRGYVWERVSGAAEPWERGVFFDSEQLEDRLLRAGAEEAVELKRMWGVAEIVLGRETPYVDPREPVRAIVAHYRLPGWSR